MSEPAKTCPKCGEVKVYANMPSGVSVPLGYQCGSLFDDDRFYQQTDKCRIRQLEAENRDLREKLAAKDSRIAELENDLKIAELSIDGG